MGQVIDIGIPDPNPSAPLPYLSPTYSIGFCLLVMMELIIYVLDSPDSLCTLVVNQSITILHLLFFSFMLDTVHGSTLPKGGGYLLPSTNQTYPPHYF